MAMLKLGIQVAQSTVSISMVPRPDRPLQTWKTFVRNHMEGIASIDLFVVPTIAFQQLFAFLVLGHERRQLLWFAVTCNRSEQWGSGTGQRRSARLGRTDTLNA